LEASTNGGHITASDLSNRTRLSTNGGHITLDKIWGDSEVETKGGHITIDSSGGRMAAETSGGHIKINHFDGEVRARTSGGHLYFRHINGSVSGSTSGGNVHASFVKLQDNSSLSTSAGNISLELPLETRAEVLLRGMNTNMDQAFNFRGSTDNGEIRGILMPPNSDAPSESEDTPRIKANCNIGNVSLSVYEK
jgi:DUF4097 and DUF4098 domain-containing protein YvlB